MNIQEIRAKYPQYGDLSDDQLGRALHSKFYADMPYEQFASKAGINKTETKPSVTPPKESSALGDIAAGAVRGAGSIGATLLAPVDMAARAMGVENDFIGRSDRRTAMDESLRGMGANPESLAFKGGKIGAEVAGTLGVGGPIGKAATMLGFSPKVAQALQTWGMTTGAKPVGLAARAGDVALRGGAGAITGGAAGGLIDPSQTGTGAAIGGGAAIVMPPVVGGALKLGRGVREALYPTPGTMAVKAAGEKADDVIRALETTRSEVPGVNLTAGQAAVPANSAEFSALQDLVARRGAPSSYFGPAGIEGQQETARLAAVQGIGQTPEALQGAIATRTAESGQNYLHAFGEEVKRDKELRELWRGNPYFREEINEAWKLLKAKGLPIKGNLTEFLHNVKLGLDARIQNFTKPDAPAINEATKRAVIDAKDKLLGWLETQNPAYATARETHKELSVPINQMRMGQELERALSSPATGMEREASFGAAVRGAGTKISKATGRPRIEALTSDQQKTLKGILTDYRRDAAYDRLKAMGAQNLAERVGKEQLPPTGFFEPVISAARSWVNRILGTGFEAGLNRAAPVFQNPQELAQLMKTASPQERAVIAAMIERALAASAVASTN